MPTIMRYALRALPQTSDDAIFISSIVVAFLSGAFFIDWMRRGHDAEAQKGYHETQMKFLREQFGRVEHLPNTCTALETGQSRIAKSLEFVRDHLQVFKTTTGSQCPNLPSRVGTTNKQYIDSSNISGLSITPGQSRTQTTHPSSPPAQSNVPVTPDLDAEVAKLRTELCDVLVRLTEAEKDRDEARDALKEVIENMDKSQSESREAGKREADELWKVQYNDAKSASEAAQNEFNNAKKSIESYQNQIADLNSELKQKKGECSDLVRENEDLEGQWKQAEKENQEKDATLEDKDEQISTLSREKERLEKAQHLDAERKEADKNAPEQNEEIEKLRKEKEQLTKQVTTEECKRVKADAESQRIQREMMSAKKQLTQCQGDVSALTKEKEDLEEAQKQTVKNHDSLKEDHARELQGVKRDLESAQSQLTQKEGQLNTLIKDKEALEETYKLSAESTGAANAQKLEVVRRDLEAAKKALDEKDATIETVQKEARSVEEYRGQTERRIADLQKQIKDEEALQDEAERMGAQLSELRDEKTNLETTVAENLKGLEECQGHKTELEDQLEGMTQQLATKSDALKEKEDALIKAQNEVAKMSEQSEHLQDSSKESNALRTQHEAAKTRIVELEDELHNLPSSGEIKRLQEAANDKQKLIIELDQAKLDIKELETQLRTLKQFGKVEEDFAKRKGLLSRRDRISSEDEKLDKQEMNVEAELRAVEEQGEDTEGQSKRMADLSENENYEELKRMRKDFDKHEEAGNEEAPATAEADDGKPNSESASAPQQEHQGIGGIETQSLADINDDMIPVTSPTPDSIPIPESPETNENSNNFSTAIDTIENTEIDANPAVVPARDRSPTVADSSEIAQTDVPSHSAIIQDTEDLTKLDPADEEDDDMYDFFDEYTGHSEEVPSDATDTGTAQPTLSPSHDTFDAAAHCTSEDKDTEAFAATSEASTVKKHCSGCNEYVDIPQTIDESGRNILKWEEHNKVCNKGVKASDKDVSDSAGINHSSAGNGNVSYANLHCRNCNHDVDVELDVNGNPRWGPHLEKADCDKLPKEWDCPVPADPDNERSCKRCGKVFSKSEKGQTGWEDYKEHIRAGETCERTYRQCQRCKKCMTKEHFNEEHLENCEGEKKDQVYLDNTSVENRSRIPMMAKSGQPLQSPRTSRKNADDQTSAQEASSSPTGGSTETTIEEGKETFDTLQTPTKSNSSNLPFASDVDDASNDSGKKEEGEDEDGGIGGK